jgi:oxygen-dependent protoporphyrinogen oxidase
VSGGAGVAVVGGGIAGLAAAWELCSSGAGLEVVVLEADERPGGKICTGEVGGRRVDLGPDAFLLRRPEALELCRELGLDGELVHPATTRAYLWCGGRLRPLPGALALGVPTRLGPLACSGVLSVPGLARAALDLCRPPASWRRARRPAVTAPGPPASPASPPTPGPAHLDAPIGELVRRRLGRQVVERLADPLIGGIHAGDVGAMSAAAVFPRLLEAARAPGSLMRALRDTAPAPAGDAGPAAPAVFAGVRGGMARLVERLVSALGEAGAVVRTGFRVDAVDRGRRWELTGAGGERVEADAVVIAAPAPVAGGLLRPHSPRLAELLGSVRYAGVVLLTMRFAAAGRGELPPGSGFLVARTGGAMLTACTWMSSKWPELAVPGEVLVRASLGRDGDERALHMDDETLVARTTAELAAPMGLRTPPEEVVVTRVPSAFPQYPVGHLGRVAAMEHEAARLGGLALAGAYLQGVGLPACIASGRRAARAVTSHLEEAARR